MGLSDPITFPLASTYDKHGIDFVQARPPRSILTANVSTPRRGRSTTTTWSSRPAIATTSRPSRASAPTASPTPSPPSTKRSTPVLAGSGFLADPGDIVIGAAEGAGCFGADPRRAADGAQRVRRDPRRMRDGRGQQRRRDPGRPHAATREHGVLISGPQAHAMKLAFAKYILWKARHGYATLP